MNCTRCQGTGFLNLHQAPTSVVESGADAILDWIDEMDAARIRYPCCCHVNPPCYSCTEYLHDVQVCDCCGNGENWYGEPGEHNNFRGPQAQEPFPECY